MMKEIINNFEDLKSLMMAKKSSESPCQEKCSNNSNGSISHILKNTANIHFSNQNSLANPTPKNTLEEEASINNPVVYQTSISYIMKFMSLLLKKFEGELEFHQKNRKEITELRQDTVVNSLELEILKSMLYFDCFIIVNKQRNPNFLKIENIIQRLKLVKDLLEEAELQLRKENIQKTLSFFNESECQKSFAKLFPNSLLQNEYFCKICSEFWKFLRSAQREEPTHENIRVSFESIKLFIYGISFPTYHLDDFPLHQAVFDSNLPMIRKICARENSPVFHCHVEQCDPAGVTPLMLAVLLGNKDAALILTNHGADPKHRSYPFARTPLEESVKRKKRGIIKTLLRANMMIKQTHWENNKSALMDLLQNLPDFSFEMNWECDSKIIPFVKKVTPSDTYKIYKLGSSLRIDLSLLGWSKLQSIRGNSSIIFNGIGEEKGRLLLIDHEKGLSVDLFDDVCGLVLENKIDDLIKHEQMQSEIKTENLVFKPALNWRGDIVTHNIEGYPTTKYNAKGTFSVLLTKRNILVDFEFKTFPSFSEYFNSVTQEPLWIFQENKGINLTRIILTNFRNKVSFVQSDRMHG